MNFLSYILAILLGSSSLAFSAPSIPASALPATLKPEPHQRDPYDWNARHEAVKKRNRAVKPEYVMIGDSITHHWEGRLPGTEKIRDRGPGRNYSVRMQRRIWALDLIMWIMPITVSKTGSWTAFLRGSSLCCWGPIIWGTARIRRRHVRTISGHLSAWCAGSAPLPKILLLGVLPRKEKNLAEPVKQTNRLLAGLHNGKDIFFADPGKALLSADGASPQNEFMKDVVHPNARGYEVLEKELAVLLKKLDAKIPGREAGGKAFLMIVF